MSLWKATKLLLTLHCEESTELMSASYERDLTAAERWAVRLHAVVCRSCRRFRRQLRFLQAAGRRRDELSVEPTLPPHCRQAILRELSRPDGHKS